MRLEYIEQEIKLIRRGIEKANNEIRVAILTLDRLEKVVAEECQKESGLPTATIENVEKVIPFLVKEPEPVKPPDPEPKIELVINDEWQRILDLMNNGRENLFITGEAGTGKSTLLNHFKQTARGVGAIIAPTGIAALRVGGSTIHRFFKFGAHVLLDKDVPRLSDTKRDKYMVLDWLLIDEISMVRADLMDAMDLFLRKNGRNPSLPFGGVRIIMFGDLFQLPPVSKDPAEKKWFETQYGTPEPYFFHAKCWRNASPRICELQTIFRQKDPVFTGALNAIRKGETKPEHISLINSRVDVLFKPPQDELWMTLTTTNAKADEANQRMLKELKTPSKIFTASVSDEFDLKNAPTDENLELKEGAVVMFIRNDADGNWVNGTMGKVLTVDPLEVEVKGVAHEVVVEKWEQRAYEYDEKKKTLVSVVTGTFTQIPLKLAAAITIHKSQGLTLEKVVIDFGYGAFAAGQSYVALSRCTTLEGMVLRKALRVEDLIISPEVQKFMKGEPIANPTSLLPLFNQNGA